MKNKTATTGGDAYHELHKEMPSAVAGAAPCSASCAKCGCDDIYRRYYDAGKDTIGQSPERDIKSTEWVNRSDAWVQPALKDCIVHHCRCCGYQWDSDPLQNGAPSHAEKIP